MLTVRDSCEEVEVISAIFQAHSILHMIYISSLTLSTHVPGSFDFTYDLHIVSYTHYTRSDQGL